MSGFPHVARALRRMLGVDRPALERPRALRREGLGKRVAPFAVAAAAGFLAVALPPAPTSFALIAAAVGLAAALAVLALLVPWERLPAAAELVPPLGYFAVIELLRFTQGGASSGYAPLAMLPVFWLALYGRRRDLGWAIAGLVLMFVAPLMIGGDQWPVAEYRRALLWVFVGGLVGFRVHGLVDETRAAAELADRQAADLRRSERRLSGVLAAVTGHAVIGADRSGVITLFNAGAERMLGWRAVEVVGRQSPALFHRPDEVAARARELGVEPGFDVFVAPLLSAETDANEWTYVRKDGAELPVQLTVSAVRDVTGNPEGYIGVAADITRRKLTERRLRDEVDDRARLASVARGLGAATDARGAICASARELADAALVVLMEPHGREVVLTASAGLDVPRLRIQRDEPSGTVKALEEARRFFVPDAATSALVSRRLVERTGAASVLYQPVLDGDEAIGVLVVTWDRPLGELSERIASRLALLTDEAASAIRRSDHLTRLDRLAHVDALTGAPNRRAWELRGPVLLERSEPGRIAVALLDLDRFKAFNDRHGHQAGDELLRGAAVAWITALRDGDLLARYGGEEFAVALPGCDIAEAEVVLDRLRAATPAGATVSAGVACWDGEESLAAVVARADTALYEAKRCGRDRLVAAC